MSGILFFIFASWHPLTLIYSALYSTSSLLHLISLHSPALFLHPSPIFPWQMSQTLNCVTIVTSRAIEFALLQLIDTFQCSSSLIWFTEFTTECTDTTFHGTHILDLFSSPYKFILLLSSLHSTCFPFPFLHFLNTNFCHTHYTTHNIPWNSIVITALTYNNRWNIFLWGRGFIILWTMIFPSLSNQSKMKHELTQDNKYLRLRYISAVLYSKPWF